MFLIIGRDLSSRDKRIHQNLVAKCLTIINLELRNECKVPY